MPIVPPNPLWLVLVVAALAIVLPAIVMRVFFRDKIMARLIRDDSFRSWYENIDTLAAIVSSIIATSWRVYDLAEWSKAGDGFIMALAISFGLFSTVFYSKLLKIRVASAEKKSVVKLEGDIATIEASRNWLVATSQLIDVLVSEKYKRFCALLEKKDLQAADLISAACSNKQILLVVQSIHEFFAEELDYNASLRLGVYFRSDTEKDSLELGYSWDGEKENCFSTKSTEYLKIVRTRNVWSELAKCYNSDEGIIINSDCLASAARGDFQYLYPEQKEKIRSLVVYRFNVADGNVDQPWIIYLDTNQPGFFDVGKKADYKLFFERVAKRLSFELVTMELAAKLPA